MALLVQKFGGTSVATQAHINHAADIVAKAKHAGHDIIVVVSAMSGETDKLIDLAYQMSESPDPREYAALVATGEQVSMALMTMALINRGLKAQSFTGLQAGIHTSGQYKKARVESIETQGIINAIDVGKVVVVAGFQGVDQDGSITTLGRGGSDTTAVALAAALKADECQIYTDVEGVYSTDPRIVPEARRLEQVTFEEMLELSSLGAKVLQIRSVEFAGKYKVPLRVLSSSKEGPGTLITYDTNQKMEAYSVTGIAMSRNEAKIHLCGIPDKPGIASTLFAELSSVGVSVDVTLQQGASNNQCDFTFTVHQDEYQTALNLLGKLANDLQATSIHGVENLAKISLVGSGLKSHTDVAPKMFKTLADEKINIELISSSETKLSVIIQEQVLDKAARALHKTFHLEQSVADETRFLKKTNTAL